MWTGSGTRAATSRRSAAKRCGSQLLGPSAVLQLVLEPTGHQQLALAAALQRLQVFVPSGRIEQLLHRSSLATIASVVVLQTLALRECMLKHEDYYRCAQH